MDIQQFSEIEFPVRCVVIRDFSDNYIRYDLIHSSMVIDLTQFISKIPMECFFQNYKLEIEKNGKRIHNEDNLFTLDLKDFDVIRMVPCLYEPTTAKEHFETLKYMLSEHPSFTSSELFDYQNLIFKDYDKLVEVSQKIYEDLKGASPYTFFNYLLNDKAKGSKEEEDKSKTKTHKPIEAANKASTEEIKQQILDTDYKKLNITNLPNSLIYETKSKLLKFRCLNALYLSAFNSKIETSEAPKGDLLYIEAITLENSHLFITSNERGFFINNSKVSNFNPSQTGNFCSYTLSGLLSLVSTGFKENFTKSLSQNIGGDEFLYLPSPADKYEWIVPVENPFYYNFRFKSFVPEKLESIVFNKEWNEEYQGILDIKNLENMNLESREKLLVPFYNNFKEVATEGAKLIANKKIKPFSVSEFPNSGYFIYGNIFITVLEDSDDFTIFNKANQSQTVYGANLDLRHINYLNKLKYDLGLKDIYFGLCCIINYKGLVLHAQVMTPGIIFNSEHLIVYGEYDDNKVRYSEDFKKEITSSLEKIGLVSNTIVTGEGLTLENYLGHPEMKGVKGVDKRNYLFDLVHLMPRDLNFEEAGALIRPELLNEYKLKKLNELLKSQESKEILQKLSQEMDGISKTAKDQKDMIKLLEKPLDEREAFYAKLEKEAREDIKINNVYKTEITTTNPSEHDIKTLENLSKFLKEEMIEKLLSECSKEEDNLPADSETFKSYLHKFGIGSRYLGIIVNKIDESPQYKKALCWLKTLILREILVKAGRSLFYEILKSVPNMHYQAFVAYFLNVFLGHPNQIKALDYFNINIFNNETKYTKPEILKMSSGENSPVNSKVASTNNDKKKKRKKKQKNNKTEINLDLKYFITENLIGSNVNFLIESNLEATYFLKPTEIWEKIVKIAKNRYGHDFKAVIPNFDLIDFNYNKTGILRDFCKKCGLSIEALDYQFNIEFNFVKTEILKQEQLTFNPDNIIDFYPVVKDYILPSEVLRPSYAEAESYFNQGHLQAATEKFKQVIILSHEINGPIHRISASCHKKLAYIAYYEGNYQNAISLITKAIIIYEKLSDFDSPVVSTCYSELASYYLAIGETLNAFKSMFKSWEISMLTYPKNHPELANKVSVLAYYFVDIDCVTNALELTEQGIRICLNFLEESDIKMSKFYLLASQLNLKNYNINNSIVYYEKYFKCTKKAAAGNPDEDKFVQSTEKILEGLRLAAEELKKKHNFVKGKENTKKIFDELIGKFVSKVNFDDPKNKFVLDPNDIQLFDFMVKNGLVKLQDGTSQSQVADPIQQANINKTIKEPLAPEKEKSETKK